MARQTTVIFLEEWLRSNSGTSSDSLISKPSALSARAIIQAWADLRDSIQSQSFQPHHLQALKTLLNSQSTLHVADPQAKLLISILTSQNLTLSSESYPLFLRLFYIWIRKSFRPSLVLIDSAVEVLSHVFASKYGFEENPYFFSEGVLLLGAIACVLSLSENSKIVCLEILCRMLEGGKFSVGSLEGLVPEILAGIGYALSSATSGHYLRVLGLLWGIWGKEGWPYGSVPYGLMILHLIEWVISGFINAHLMDKIQVFNKEVFETANPDHVPFAIVMAAAGVLRASSRLTSVGDGFEEISSLAYSAESWIKSLAQNLVFSNEHFSNAGSDPANSLILHCISLALTRSGPVSYCVPLLKCLASTLLTEIFPLNFLYKMVLESEHCISTGVALGRVKEHLTKITFKEAGAISGAFCNQYVGADEENKGVVENLVWEFCEGLYLQHQQVALLLRGIQDELLENLEKVAQSAFLMVVVFALAVTKHRLNSKFSNEAQIETSVRILVSFSCVEYFRRLRLPEYMDTIRRIVVSVQENESACVTFIESMPSYAQLTNHQASPFMENYDYVWYKDDIQTARVLFYLRVMPTCIDRLPAFVFRRVVAPTMYLYMGHPNAKIARASHTLFVAFISSLKESDEDERMQLKEQLAFFYMQRSLEGYPGVTPFDGMASGVAALARNLPAGSPALFYSVHGLVEKATTLCSDVPTLKTDVWKNWQGEVEPCKKVLELLLRLITLVDIQVLPNLMKLLAQLIIQLPKDGQNMVLDDLYSQIAESDDVIRKPSLVSWLQSLNYLCSQATRGVLISEARKGQEERDAAAEITNEDRLNARL